MDISSSVGGTPVIQNRELIGRLNTTNPLLPTGTIIEFTSATAVGTYFGTSSEEYKRANSTTYFEYVSKTYTKPLKISFARWADADTEPLIFGARFTTTLTQFQAISDGNFTLIIGGVSHDISGLDFTAAVSLAGVAAVIQAEIRTNTGTQWTAADVVYDSTRGAFNFTGGDAGAATISATTAGTGTNILNLIGWGSTAIFSNGADEQTVTEFLNESTNVSNNFGSFVFLPTLTLDGVTEATVWNNAAEQNVAYQYYVPITIANAATYSAALLQYAGTGLVISETVGEYPEQLPMAALAATNYDVANSTINYMYLQTTLTPSVTDTVTSDTLDNLRVNYYGQTQQAGQPLSFFQRGTLTGEVSDPTDMNVYSNEQWFKDAAGVAMMRMLLSANSVAPNAQGRALVLTSLQAPINQALLNGTITIEKQLTVDQKAFITAVTGDSDAWYQVQATGDWVDVNFVQYTTSDNRIEFKAVYTLIYSKGDLIRKVEGSQILI